MATQADKSFDTLVKHLQKLNESENAIKQKLAPSGRLATPAAQVQPKLDAEVEATSAAVEGPGVKDRSEEYLKKSEQQLESIDKTLKEIKKSVAKGAKSSTSNNQSRGEYGSDSKVTTKGLPGLPKEYTLTEGLKSTVGIAKSIGKGISNIAINPKASLTKAFGSVKETMQGALGTAKDILSAEAGYTPERERFAKGYAASAKGTQFQKGGKSALDAGKDKYDALKAKQDEIDQVKEKMEVASSQGFSPLKKGQKLLDTLNKEFNSIDPRAPVSVKKEKSPNEKITAAAVNPEADNIESSGEIVSKEIKQTNDLIGENLSVVKQQLEELKGIRLALAPQPVDDPKKDPNKGVIDKLDEVVEAVKNIQVSGGGGLSDLIPSGGKAAAGGKLANAMSKLGKVAKIGGAALAIGAGAYTAYQGYTAAEENKQNKLADVQAKVDAGEMTPEEAAAARKEIGNTATVEKSTAVGEGTGLAAGAIAGGLAGAKLGATVGTFLGGPVGTAIGAGVGGLAGGALGAFAGSETGKYLGEKAGEGINYLKDNGGKIVDKAGSFISEKASSLGSAVSGWFGGSRSNTTTPTATAVPGNTAAVNRMAGETVVPAVQTVAPIEPKPLSNTTGPAVIQASTENADLNREASRGTTNVTPIVSNNSSTNNNTSYVPVKPTPRNERGGSALDRYHDRVSAF